MHQCFEQENTHFEYIAQAYELTFLETEGDHLEDRDMDWRAVLKFWTVVKTKSESDCIKIGPPFFIFFFFYLLTGFLRGWKFLIN
jgi:hypothetical protein